MKRPWVCLPACSRLLMLDGFDLVPLREGGLSHANPAVRRQAALAAGRIGDAAAIDLLLASAQRFSAHRPGRRRRSRSDCSRTHARSLVAGKDPRRGVDGAGRAAARGRHGDRQNRRWTQGTRALSDTPCVRITRLRDAGRECRAARIVGGSGKHARPRRRAGALHRLAVDGSTSLCARCYSTALLSCWRGLAGSRAAHSWISAIDPDPASRAPSPRGESGRRARQARASTRVPPSPGCDGLLNDPDAHIRINALRALASFRDSTVAGCHRPARRGSRHRQWPCRPRTTLGVVGW